jgi:hypothetical protein
MTQQNIFISAGTPRSEEQRLFKRAVVSAVRNLGFVPRTCGDEPDDTDHPFGRPVELIARVLTECDGAVVIAYEKHFAPEMIDNRVSVKPVTTSSVKLTSAWNHAEAAIAYTQSLPLLLISERGVRQDGMLENDVIGHVDETDLSPAYVSSGVFQGRLNNWAQAVRQRSDKPRRFGLDDFDSITLGQIWSLLRRVEWKAMTTLVTGAFVVMGAAFSLGRFIESLHK